MGNDLDVRGGPWSGRGRIEIDLDAVGHLGQLCRGWDRDLGSTVSVLGGVLAQAQAELAATFLYPVHTAAQVEAHLTGATVASWLRGADVATLGTSLDAAVAAYRAADRAAQVGVEAVTDVADAAAMLGVITLGGVAVVEALPVVAVGSVVVAVCDPEFRRTLGDFAGHALAPQAYRPGREPVTVGDVGHSFVDALARRAGAVNDSVPGGYRGVVDEVLSHGPVISHATNGTLTLAGLVLAPLHLLVPKLVPAPGRPGPQGYLPALIASWEDDRPAIASAPRRMPVRDMPRDTSDLVERVDPVIVQPGRAGWRGAHSVPTSAPDPNAPSGRVDITTRTWVDAQGHKRTSCIVTLPGTSSWPMPGDHSRPDVRDTLGNLRARAGLPTAESEAVAKIIRERVPRGADLCLVGHSQGGMTAYQVAHDPSVRAHCHVTHVVTAGTPTHGMATVPGVHTLALENDKEFVPALDGHDQRGDRDHISVRFKGDEDAKGVAGHEVKQYGAGARKVDDAIAAANEGRDGSDGARSLAEFDREMREHGYLADRGTDQGRIESTRIDLNRAVEPAKAAG